MVNVPRERTGRPSGRKLGRLWCIHQALQQETGTPLSSPGALGGRHNPVVMADVSDDLNVWFLSIQMPGTW